VFAVNSSTLTKTWRAGIFVLLVFVLELAAAARPDQGGNPVNQAGHQRPLGPLGWQSHSALLNADYLRYQSDDILVKRYCASGT
jgi:hypothetical protein